MKPLWTLIALVTMISSIPAIADDTQRNDEKRVVSEEPPPVKDDAIKLFLDKIEVVGELEKPQAVFIIPGNSPEIDDIRIERSFFKNIFRPVERKALIITNTDDEKRKPRKDVIPW